MRFIKREKQDEKLQKTNPVQTAEKVKNPVSRSFQTVERLGKVLNCSSSDIASGRYRVGLYRFLADNIPVISACVSTWARLSAAPGEFEVTGTENKAEIEAAQKSLGDLAGRIYQSSPGNRASLVTFLTDLFIGLYRDGVYGGFVTVRKDGSGVDKFVPVDSADLSVRCDEDRYKFQLDVGEHAIGLERDDFYFIPMNADIVRPLGRSILQAIPLVTYIEQQLVDDMRR